MSDRIVTWGDMEKFAAEKFCNITSHLTGMAGVLNKHEWQKPIGPQERLAVTQNLKNVAAMCRQIGLVTTAHIVDAAIHQLETQANIRNQVSQLVSSVGVAITAEMKSHLFLRIYPDRVEWYDKPDLFGAQVQIAFPSAERDIREAGTCYALDRGTASVMHSMRVLEVSLTALAMKFDVSFDRQNWENIINDIEAKIATVYIKGKPPADRAQWKKEGDFYSAAAKDFRYFKNAWRNHSMHYREHYDAGEAKSIMEHVRTFTVHLAENGLTE